MFYSSTADSFLTGFKISNWSVKIMLVSTVDCMDLYVVWNIPMLSIISAIRGNKYSLTRGSKWKFLNHYLHDSLSWVLSMILITFFCGRNILLVSEDLPQNMYDALCHDWVEVWKVRSPYCSKIRGTSLQNMFHVNFGKMSSTWFF